MSGTEDTDLVARCREGNDEAWRELVDRFGPRVYAIAYHFTMKREDAEELSQEIFLKVFENLHRYDGGFPLVAWILSVSRNLCIDRYRRRKREKSFRFVSDEAVTSLLKSEDDPASMALKKERTKLLFSALSEIPEDLAEILVLRDLNGLAYDEIGKALDLPEGTVKSRLFRARAEVARKIRERHESRGAASHVRLHRGRRGGDRMSCREIERLFVAGSDAEIAAHRKTCAACARLGADADDTQAMTSVLTAPHFSPELRRSLLEIPRMTVSCEGAEPLLAAAIEGDDEVARGRSAPPGQPSLPLRRLHGRGERAALDARPRAARAAALARDAARRGEAREAGVAAGGDSSRDAPSWRMPTPRRSWSWSSA